MQDEEYIRCEAIKAAAKMYDPNRYYLPEQIISIAQMFEDYIKTGERPR